MRLIIIFLCVVLTVSCRQNYSYHDIEIFHDTPIYELAKMADSEDTIGMNQFISQETMFDIDSPDPIFNKSLLMWCISNGKLNSAKILLNNHANPNFVCKRDGKTPLILASGYRDKSFAIDDSFLLLLLDYGADANMISIDSLGKPHNPIYKAAGTSAEYVKELIDIGGGNPNMSLNSIPIIEVAVIQNKIETVYYLSIVKNVSLNVPLRSLGDGKSKNLIDIVRDMEFSPGSKEDKLKNKILTAYE